MARMPQIPGVDYSQRPEGSVPVGRDLPVDGGQQALETGAQAIERFADQRQKALDAKRNVVTDVAAIKAASDYSLGATDIAGTFQQKYADDPYNPKLRAEFTDALNSHAEASAAAISDPDVQFKVLERFASINAKARGQMEDWSERQAVVKTKSTAFDLEQQYGRAAASAGSPLALSQMLPSAKSDLGKIYAQVTDDPAKALAKTRQSMVKGWAETASAQPHGAFAVLADLADPKGVIRREMPADEVVALTKKAEASFKGGGVTAQLNALATAHKDISNVLNLAVGNDPKFMSASLAVRDKISRDIEATEANTDHLPPDARQARLDTLGTSAKIIDTLDMMYRSNPGVFQGKTDRDVTADILSRASAAWLKKGADEDGIGDHFKEALQLRHDAAVAFHNGSITKDVYEAAETKLQLMIPKSEAAQDRGGSVHIPALGIGVRTPLQAGNQRMDELLDAKGPYAGLTKDQRNEAWLSYIKRVSAMQKNEQGAGVLTAETAKQAAYESLEAAK